MGQAANASRTAENEARAYVKYIRTSPQKLNLVAQTIRGQKAEKALVDLQFSKRRVAQDVLKALQSAVANAENNYQYDVDNLYIKEAYVGKSMVLKRFRARAKGRASSIKKRYSNVTIVLSEKIINKKELHGTKS